MFLVISDFIAAASHFSSLIFFLILLCYSFWVTSDPDVICYPFFSQLPLFLNPSSLRPFFPPSGLIPERENWDFDSNPCPHPHQKCSSFAFSCDHSLTKFFKKKPLWGLQWFPGHLRIPTLYCSPFLACGLTYSLSHPGASEPQIQNLFLLSELLSLHLFLRSFLLDLLLLLRIKLL